MHDALSLPAMSKPRVLTYTTLFPNSIQPLWGNFVLERMRHLLPFVDVTVIAPVPYFPRIRLNRRWFEFASVPHTERLNGFDIDHPRYLVFPRFGMFTHAYSMFAGSVPQVRKRLSTSNYDLIDAHYVYPDGLAAVMLGAKFRKPVVVSARGSDINVFSDFPTIRPMIRAVLRRADALVAVSDDLKKRMMQLGCPGEKITVVENGVDTDRFRPLSKLESRRKLGLPDARPIVLSVGHLKDVKGFDLLIDAAGRLQHRRPTPLLVIVGEGTERSRLERQIARLNLGDNVRLAGACPHADLAVWYSAADVFCLASSSEGWPNVLFEAMACGLPVVAPRAWSAPEIVVSENIGLLVERTSDAFASAIDHAVNKRWNTQGIVAYARSHGWNNVAARMCDLFSSVLSKGGLRRAAAARHLSSPHAR
jgi:glycosyltransferase involved in cell wall biosynthesis